MTSCLEMDFSHSVRVEIEEKYWKLLKWPNKRSWFTIDSVWFWKKNKSYVKMSIVKWEEMIASCRRPHLCETHVSGLRCRRQYAFLLQSTSKRTHMRKPSTKISKQRHKNISRMSRRALNSRHRHRHAYACTQNDYHITFLNARVQSATLLINTHTRVYWHNCLTSMCSCLDKIVHLISIMSFSVSFCGVLVFDIAFPAFIRGTWKK